MRRRIVSRGFEGLELPQARGWRPVGGEDVELLQGGELPRRRLVSQAPARSEGPAAFGQPFEGGRGLLDRPDAQNLGRSVDVPLVIGVQPQTYNILNLSGADERTQVLSLTLSREYINPIAGDYIGYLWAFIQWGAGGVQYNAICDFASGTVIQLCCSSLRVDVRGNGQGTVKCMAQVGYGAVGDKSAQLTQRTALGAVIAAGGVATFGLPSFVLDYQFQRTPSTANCLLEHLNRAGTVLSEVSIGNGPGGGSELIRIPGDAYSVRLTNGLAAAINSARFLYRLHM